MAHIPLMVWTALATLVVDLIVAFMAVQQVREEAVLMLLYLGSILAWWGGFEALHWISAESPWAIRPSPRSLGEYVHTLQREASERRELEQVEARQGYLSRKVAEIRRVDFNGWRSLVLRLLSASSLVFFSSTMFLIYVAPHCPQWMLPALLWVLLAFLRSLPAGLGALFVAPLGLAIGLFTGKNKPADLQCGALAFTLSGLTLLKLYQLTSNPDEFWQAVLNVGLNVPGYAYGFMIGGALWWLWAAGRGPESEAS